MSRVHNAGSGLHRAYNRGCNVTMLSRGVWPGGDYAAMLSCLRASVLLRRYSVIILRAAAATVICVASRLSL